MPLKKQTAAASIAHKALAVGIDGYRVDGNDAIAVAAVMHEALERARAEHRASIVEALTYRLCDHTTADDASRYRPADELEAARELEPVGRFRRFLERDWQWSADDDAALVAECAAAVEAAVETYQAFPEQPAGEFFDYLFEKPTVDLERQKQELLKEIRRHG